MTDRFEQLLAETGQSLAWPESPDVVNAVSARISAPRPRPWLPRLAFAAATIVLVGAALLVFSPATRTAVADFLGIGGVRITHGPPLEGPIGGGFELGQRVSDTAEAGELAGFDVTAPGYDALGEPDEVWVQRDTPGGPLVALLYGARPGIPAASDEDAALLFTQFRAPLAGDEFFAKKLTPGGTQVTRVRIGEVEGYWLEGEPHFFYYQALNGDPVEESIRMVGNVLLWEQDGFTYRLEVGDLPIVTALEIAATVD